GWGISKWSELFSKRQLLLMQTLILQLNELKDELNTNDSEYSKAIITYLSILIDRGSAINTSFGRWDVSRENVQSPFSKQAIPMMYDYPEANLLGNSSGSLLNQLDWIIRYIVSENGYPFSVNLNN